MGTLGEILKEQAPVLVNSSIQDSKEKVLKMYQDFPPELFEKNRTKETIDWVKNFVEEVIISQEEFFGEIMKSWQDSLASSNLELYFHIINLRRKFIQDNNGHLILFIDFLAEYDSKVNSSKNEENWKILRREVKKQVRVSDRISEESLSEEYAREQRIVSILYQFSRKKLSFSGDQYTLFDGLKTVHLKELESGLENRIFEILENNYRGIKSTWQVLKFGQETPGYRLIIRGKEILGIFTHKDYEEIFLESLYAGHAFPPHLRKTK